LGELAGAGEGSIAALGFDGSGDFSGVPLIAQFPENIRQFAGWERVHEVCRGGAGFALIHAHVQRPVFLEGKPALGSVELMGTHTEIEQDPVERFGGDPPVCLGEITLMGLQSRLPRSSTL
jgi:hypothetical protein